MVTYLSGAISGLDPDQFLAPPAVQPFINYLTRENATELIDEAYEKIQSTADIADALASEIDENNLRNTLQSLLMHGPRFATTPSTSYMRYRTEFTEYSPDKYESALQEIKANISALGLPVYQQYIDTYNTYAMSRPYVNTSNLFTFMPGKSTDLVSVGAHLDTLRETVGANDNGSGVVSLLETIRVLTESDVEFENPVLFCFWAKEEKPPRVFEIGLVGSMHFTQNTQEVLNHFTNGTSGAGSSGKMAIKCHINLDIVGGRAMVILPLFFLRILMHQRYMNYWRIVVCTQPQREQTNYLRCSLTILKIEAYRLQQQSLYLSPIKTIFTFMEFLLFFYLQLMLIVYIRLVMTSISR